MSEASVRARGYRTSALRPSEWYQGRVLMSQPHHALLFIMTALPWQCLLQTSLLAAVAAAESCLKVRGDGPRVYHSFL